MYLCNIPWQRRFFQQSRDSLRWTRRQDGSRLPTSGRTETEGSSPECSDGRAVRVAKNLEVNPYKVVEAIIPVNNLKIKDMIRLERRFNCKINHGKGQLKFY